jgi:sugar lactone lactonase YvrE
MGLLAAGLVVAGAVGLQRVVASRSATTSAAVAASSTRNTGAPLTRALPASGPKIIGTVEGNFDAKTQTITSLSSSTRDVKVTFKAFGRSDANTLLPQGGHTITYVRSCANPHATAPCQSTAPSATVSAEMRIGNTSAVKFYNTRLIFVDFLDTRGGIPVTANAFFNDGQVAANGKLGVSRDYGDIDTGSSATRVWAFAFPAGSLSNFYFRAVIYADLGVATESVEPAAVQNNADRTITINGQGFNSPTVTLLNASGTAVATLASTVVSASQLTATVPTGTAAGIYSVRVTNTGGTPGGTGSSTLIGRLTVTGVPDGAHIGEFTTFSDVGPYRITGNTTISGTILPGTVIYIDSGVTLSVGASGLNANGGIPGVTATSPAQIVFTASPGAASWGGIDATSAATTEVAFKNCVVEFGGSTAQINISGSGRTLRFTDSISRRSAGAGLRATGTDDRFTGFTRSRVENNAGVGVLLSANAALGIGTTGAGMGDLDASNANTRVPDQGYYYSAANVVRNNGTNAIQIDAAANDFTRSGVLVGQGDIPLQIRGTSGNPSTVGNAGPSPGAELSINPNALIQLDAGMDFKAGDDTLFGNIAANGYAGYSHSTGGDTGISQRIVIDKIPGGGNFGALFFSIKSAGSSILNFVSVRNGGSSGLGSAQVIIDAITYAFSFTNSESNGSSTYGLQYRSGTTVSRTGTTYSGNPSGNENVVGGDPVITTIAGGVFGDGNQANQAPLVKPVAFAVDPGRGVYIADQEVLGAFNIRFANTTNAPVKVAGITVPANSIKKLTSGRPIDVSIIVPNDTPMDGIDLLQITGMALSADKNVLFFTNIDTSIRMVCWINVSPGADTGSNPIKLDPGDAASVKTGNVGTLYNTSTDSNLSDDLRGIAVNPVSKRVYVADAKNGKVQGITATGTLSTFAGNGTAGRPRPFAWQAFPFPGSGASADATSVLIYTPQAIAVSDDGNTVYISDADFARVMRVQAGTIRLVTQLGTFAAGVFDNNTNPMPSGVALRGGKLYISNIGVHSIVSVDNPDTVTAQATPGTGETTIPVPPVSAVSGTPGTNCEFTSTACGDGGAIGSMGFDFRKLPSNLNSDSNGLFVADQLFNARGRIRYLNLSGGAVAIGAVNLTTGTGNTVIGSGLPEPYNGGLATSALLNSPASVALDSNGNAFIADSDVEDDSALRFINRGTTSVTILGQTVAPGNIIRINKDANDEESTNPNNAFFYVLQGLKWTSEGLYIVDSNGKSVPAAQGLSTSKLRFLNLSASPVTFYGTITVQPGEIKTIAGGSTDPSGIGDGGIATSAKLLGTTDVEVDPTTKDIYLSESYANNKRVRKILRSTGIISSILTGNQYTGLAFDTAGRLLISVYDTNQVLRETGVGTGSFTPVTSSIAINKPRDIAVDSSNNLYVMNGGTAQIIKLPLGGGAATNFAGTASMAGFAGDSGAPTSAKINIDANPIDIDTSTTIGNFIQTVGIAVGPSGEVVFVDNKNTRIRQVR